MKRPNALFDGFEIVANKTKMLRTPTTNVDLTPGQLADIGRRKGMPKKNSAEEEKKKADERLALLGK